MQVTPNPVPTSYTETIQFQNLPTHLKDILIQSLSEAQLNEQFLPQNPSLPPPLLLVDFFASYLAAVRDHHDTLIYSEQIDQLFRRNSFLNNARNVSQILEQMAALEAARANADVTADQTTLDIQNKVNSINQNVVGLNTQTASLNAGNNAENFQAFQVSQASNTFQFIIGNNLGGVTTTGGSIYDIPAPSELSSHTAEEVISEYNAAAAAYTTKINAFNTYWSGRIDEVNAYNANVTAYNADAVLNNQALANLETAYNLDLSQYMQPQAQYYTFPANMTFPLPVPSAPITSLPATVHSAITPIWVNNKAGGGVPPPIPLNNYIGSVSPTNSLFLRNAIYFYLYVTTIQTLLTLLGNLLAAAGVVFKSIGNVTNASAKDPLANDKPFMKRLIPEAIIKPNEEIKSVNSKGANSLSAQTILSGPHVETLLGKSLLSQMISNLNLNITEKQKQELVEQLLVLGQSFAGITSFQSTLPGLSLLAEDLQNLPPNSPAYALLFALSFANRSLENANLDLNSDAIKSFLTGIPELAGITLTDENIKDISTALNLSLLLLSTKLLASTLGLPALLPQLFSSLLTPEELTVLLNEVATEQGNYNQEIGTKLQEYFLSQDFGSDEAKFLADVAVNALALGAFLSPTSTTISAATVNVELLKGSITANLILEGFSLNKAEELSNRIINKILIKGALSTEEFTRLLEINLRLEEVPKARLLASQAIIIPRNESLKTAATAPAEEAPPPAATAPVEEAPAPIYRPSVVDELASKKLADHDAIVAAIEKNVLDTLTAPVNPPLPDTVKREERPEPPKPTFKGLSQEEIVKLLEKRSLELLIPHLDAKLAKLITEKIAQALFGSPNPDSYDKGNVKSPVSLVNSIKNQAYHFLNKEEEKYVDKLATSFKEANIESTDLNAFYQKLMNPAYSLIYASGIIYGHTRNSNEKGYLDIVV